MCAISGIIGRPIDESGIENMISTMYRRGPDGQGVFRENNVTLMHTRLAVIDPERGRQPMQLTWAAEEYVLVYNGELYNTEELRRSLESLGHCFVTHSDTEVVLHAYAEYGYDCVEHFNGIFAFAIWEKKAGCLFMARDRIGVKPLFYRRHADTLIFASEIKTILACPGEMARLGYEGAAQLILLGPGRLPGSGVFQGIQELEPGHTAVYSDGRLTIRQYWKLRDREHRDSFQETAAYIRYLVEDAIRRQMVSDVPIGTFLSGGLDSSIITAVCTQDVHSRGLKLPTFSVDYENNDRYFMANKFQPDGDSAYIRLIQTYLDTDHHWTVLSAEDLANALEEATIARDLPGMADVDFSLLVFSKQIRTKVKVALSGECADEIFGGYPWYRDSQIREKQGFPWAQNTLQRVSLLHLGLPFSPEDFIMDTYLETCRNSDILPGASAQERRMKEMVNLNFRFFMQTLLDRKDRMSMYHSLEVRVPFCDYRIAEYLYGVPWEYKDYKGREKGLLRYAVKDLLPKEILYRKKSPYPKTFDPQYELWMQQRLQRILQEDSPIWYLISREEAQKIQFQEAVWPWYGQLMRRPQTMAYLLQLDFWLRHYQVEFCF